MPAQVTAPTATRGGGRHAKGEGREREPGRREHEEVGEVRHREQQRRRVRHLRGRSAAARSGVGAGRPATICTTIGVNSTAVASRLSTAVIAVASKATATTSWRGEWARRSTRPPAAWKSPASRATSVMTKIATRNPSVGPSSSSVSPTTERGSALVRSTAATRRLPPGARCEVVRPGPRRRGAPRAQRMPRADPIHPGPDRTLALVNPRGLRRSRGARPRRRARRPAGGRGREVGDHAARRLAPLFEREAHPRLTIGGHVGVVVQPDHPGDGRELVVHRMVVERVVDRSSHPSRGGAAVGSGDEGDGEERLAEVIGDHDRQAAPHLRLHEPGLADERVGRHEQERAGRRPTALPLATALQTIAPMTTT